jgi:hypothetical protein
MKKNMNNKSHIEGLLYQHSLELKVSGENSKNPGTEFISGTIEIATDDKLLNIVPVHFTYSTATTSTGKSNTSYAILLNIINGTYGSVMGGGKDTAVKLSIDSNINLNEFYSDRTGKEELVSVKRNEGGFVRVVNELNADEKMRNTFDVDIVITNVRHVDADDEKKIAEKAIIKGAIFDYKKALLPVEFSATNPHAMDYFESLGASPKTPVFTQIKGRQISETVVNTITEESAFGEPQVREVKSSHKDFVVTWARPEPYEWDDESTITGAEMTEAMAARETYLATMKQRQDEYKASKNANSAFAAPATGDYDF